MSFDALPAADRAAYQRAYARAARLMKDQMVVTDRKLGPLTWWVRFKLWRAKRAFRRAIAVYPAWQAMWVLGKVHERLGETLDAYPWFARAFDDEPTNPDVAREACRCAMELGHTDAAVRYAEAGVRANPADAGLIANLALANLFAKRLDAALACAAHAVERDPDDAISKNVLGLIRAVRAGERPAPRNLRELKGSTKT